MARPISSDEAEVIERALRIAPTRHGSPKLISSVRSLHVTAVCECGCATIWFGADGDASPGRIAADARATSGETDIDVIIWANEEFVVGLELVGPGATLLPDPDSVRAHDVA